MLAEKQTALQPDIGLRAVLASGLVCFCAGALYGWSALIAPLQATFAVTTAQTGLVFSLAIVSFTLAVIATPMIPIETARPRIVGAYGFIAALCVYGAAHAASFPAYLLWFSGGFGAASGGVYITALGVAGRMRRHTVATPAMVAAFGLGGAVFGPLWRQLDGLGWGLSGLIPLGVVLVVASLIAALTPAPRQHVIAQNRGPAIGQDVYTRRMMRLIWILFALGSFSGLMVLGLGAKMMDAAGANAGLASVGMAGIALGNTGGRLSVAGLSQRLQMEQILSIALALTLIGLTVALIPVSPASVCLGLFLVAMGYGLVASTVPVLTRITFGSLSFQRSFAVIFTAWGLAGFLAPWVGGALYDLGQSFTLPLICAVFTAVTFGIAIRRLAKGTPSC